jgi:hypothetical protein
LAPFRRGDSGCHGLYPLRAVNRFVYLGSAHEIDGTRAYFRDWVRSGTGWLDSKLLRAGEMLRASTLWSVGACSRFESRAKAGASSRTPEMRSTRTIWRALAEIGFVPVPGGWPHFAAPEGNGEPNQPRGDRPGSTVRIAERRSQFSPKNTRQEKTNPSPRPTHPGPRKPVAPRRRSRLRDIPSG